MKMINQKQLFRSNIAILYNVKSFKYEIYVLINYNNLCRFMDIKKKALNKFAKPKYFFNIIFE